MDKNVVILILKEDVVEILSIAEKLKKKGLRITGLHNSGVITGTIEERKIQDLSKVKGLQSINDDLPVDLEPPDAEIQ